MYMHIRRVFIYLFIYFFLFKATLRRKLERIKGNWEKRVYYLLKNKQISYVGVTCNYFEYSERFLELAAPSSIFSISCLILSGFSRISPIFFLLLFSFCKGYINFIWSLQISITNMIRLNIILLGLTLLAMALRPHKLGLQISLCKLFLIVTLLKDLESNFFILCFFFLGNTQILV